MWLGPFRTRSCYALARAFRHRHHEVVIDDLYLDRPQPHPRIALMLTGLDVEFIAMPGTGDIGLILGERQAQARLVLCDHLLHTRIDLTLTDGSSHVRADVLECSELAVHAKYANLGTVELDDLAAGVRERRHLANHNLSHACVLPLISGGDTTSPSQRR